MDTVVDIKCSECRKAERVKLGGQRHKGWIRLIPASVWASFREVCPECSVKLGPVLD